MTEKEFAVRLGSNLFINCATLISYRGESLFNIRRRDSDGLLGIDCDIYDRSKKKIATMRHGNIVSGDRDNYEIKLEPHHYTITEKSSGRMICELHRRDATANAEIDLSVDLFTPDGFRLLATPTGTNLPGGNLISGCTMRNCGTGIAIS